MELLLEEVFQDTMQSARSEEDTQRLRYIFELFNLKIIGLLVKSETFTEELRKQLFHQTVAHLKYITSIQATQIEDEKLRDLIHTYIYQLKRLRGKLRSELEQKVVEGISNASKANLGNLLIK